MFKTVRYLIKTPWAEIQKDRQDYKKLNDETIKCWQEMDVAEQYITHVFEDPRDEPLIVACIKNNRVVYIDPDDPGAGGVCQRKTYCPHFYQHKILACLCDDCPFHEKNKNYVAACANYSRAMDARRKFWKNRIAQRLNLNQGKVK